jgi:hypothetical protein
MMNDEDVRRKFNERLLEAFISGAKQGFDAHELGMTKDEMVEKIREVGSKVFKWEQ